MALREGLKMVVELGVDVESDSQLLILYFRDECQPISSF